VALDRWFSWVATNVDALLIDGMNDAISGGLIWGREMAGVALSLTVICYAFLMMYGKRDGWSFASVTMKAMVVAALLKTANYNYYVRDLFFTDLPNKIAKALGGPRMDVNSAQQFDVVWEATVHHTYFVVAQAAWYEAWMPKLMAGYDLLMLLICFGVWSVSRVLLSVVIALGPFLIILAMFEQTIGYVKQWVGKLIALTILGLGSSIVMRFVFVLITSWLKGMQMTASMSVDELMIKSAGICVLFTISAILMITLPAALSFGSSIGGATAAASGLLGGAITTAGGAARSVVINGAQLGK
jgi:type IV secretion system protein VirB6